MMILILISGVDKGLEMSDEGNSLMLYKDPYLYGYYSSFNFLVAKLPSCFASDVWNLRAINIGLRVLSAGVLAWGAWSWLNATMSYRRSIGLLLCLCAVSIACNLVPSPLDKNVVSNSLISLAAGLLLILLSLNSDLTENDNRAWLIMGLVGALTGLAFFAHFTSAIIFYLLTMILVSVLRNDRFPLLSLQALGLVLSLLLYFGCFEEFGFWYTTFRDQIGSEATGNHQLHVMASVYWLNIQTVAKEFWLYFSILLPVVIVTTLIAIRTGTGQKTVSRRFSKVLTRLVSAGFGLTLFVSGGFLSPYLSYFLGLIVMAIALTIFVSMNKIVCSKLASGKPLLLVGGALLLAVLPFAAHFGTRNPILSHALLYQAPW